MAPRKRMIERFRQYHFELKHILILFVILIFFQMFTTLVHKLSLRKFLFETQSWYQHDFAERLSNLSATSLELLLETTLQTPRDEENTKRIVQAFNIVLSQQLLQQHVEEVCLLLDTPDGPAAIDNGKVLYDFLFEEHRSLPLNETVHEEAINLYHQNREEISSSELTFSVVEDQQIFHVFVPFVPKGEYIGVLYLKSKPTFGFLTSEIMTSYNQTTLIFTALILFGFLAMFYISSYTVTERDETQKLLYAEREKKLKEQLHHQKEALFTKRIYHTHHKAEKVMGFIKEDLRRLSDDNIDEIKYRVIKYANFISRVIYDMKWYDPPIQTIRSSLFQTNLNEVVDFIVTHLFQRVASTAGIDFRLDLDKNLPVVQVNEFVVWEVLEPLVQNAIEHTSGEAVTIGIETRYNAETNVSRVLISDNGQGISPELLEEDSNGVQMLFHEHLTTKTDHRSSGYGCYIAYEIAKQRCGWDIMAENIDGGGARFIITIKHA